MIHENDMKKAVKTFKRIGRWGTCGDCPWIGNTVYPEKCQYARRRDHKLTREGLQEQLNHYTNIWKIEKIAV